MSAEGPASSYRVVTPQASLQQALAECNAARKAAEAEAEAADAESHEFQLLAAKAEARVAELETALRDIYDQGCLPGVEPAAYSMWLIARALLSPTPEA